MKAVPKLFLGVTLAVLGSGCSKAQFTAELAVEKRELGEIYDGYMAYLGSHKTPPTSLVQLAEHEAAHAAGIRALRLGKYKMEWGITDKDTGKVLAYETSALEQGGVVLMADGTVKTMSAAQVQAAIKQRN